MHVRAAMSSWQEMHIRGMNMKRIAAAIGLTLPANMGRAIAVASTILASPAWAELRTVETGEGFAIRMPGQPEAMRNTVQISGGEVKTASWTAPTGDGAIYSVSYADYPEKIVVANTPDQFMNEGRDGLANQLKGKIVSETAVTLGNHPGKAVAISSDAGEVKARFYWVGTRLYTLLVLYNAATGAPDADAFLGSIKLAAK
ncbi:hypothetical protein IC614_04850 [Allosphingosinicella flava]|uniref:Uncharacterized protein n=1 Tax=Allosphingosinicella flava TaxID=2771430 RepID=A0A7T2LN26_9SPHN|nr:hypothetical protein [Sphingosinicella flava]QPQ55913.1 hypothetical protein IC614_04850 [Sphingosinicella flava]